MSKILSFSKFFESNRLFPEIAKFMKQDRNTLWGESGENGLMYRGINLFDFYVSDEVQKQFDECIIKDYEDDPSQYCEGFGTGDYQEVYLGYMAHHEEPRAMDRFYAGFDVFTEKTKAILLSFKIEVDNGKGKIIDLQVDDGSLNLFYSHEDHSIYKGIQHYQSINPGSWIDLRLD